MFGDVCLGKSSSFGVGVIGRGVIALCLLLAVLTPAGADDPESGLELLSDGELVVGVLPRAGGAVVLCRLGDRGNVLLSNPDFWSEPESETPEPDAVNLSYKDYQGHIVWVAPQHEWWTGQDLNEKKRERGDNWPPDSWLVHGRYEIIERSGTHIKLRGQASPVSGARLTKEVSLTGGGRVELRVTLENASDREVSLGIWTNTRFNGLQQPFASYDSGIAAALRMDFGNPGKVEAVPFLVEDGFFSFVPARHPEKRRVSKAFLRQRPGEAMAAATFNEDTVFVKHAVADLVEPAPLHAAIEIYQSVESAVGEGGDLLELEFHGGYRRLAPGESASFTEYWQLAPWDGGDDMAARRAKILELLK